MTGDGLPAAAGPGAGGKPELRASDEDRDRAVDRLRAAAGDGRLTAAELDERLSAALTARTDGELAALTADLPEAGGIAAQAKDVVRLDYEGGNATRRGRWIVPQRMEIRAVGGTVKLDFTEAVITTRTLHIQAEVRGGGARPGNEAWGIEVDADDVAVRGGRVRVRPEGSHGEFVPHLSITVTLALVVADVAILVVFIDHIAKSIQLPQVIASIASDLAHAIDSEGELPSADEAKAGPSLSEMLVRLDEDSGVVRAPRSGYLQYVSMSTLIDIARQSHAVIRLLHRPGHFVVEGQPLADVWPAAAAPGVARALGGAHATGPHRTLTQDLSFAVDQLVEIAIRALSPAVNDTFTALACIDWLGDGLGKIAERWRPAAVRRDASGRVRVITVTISFRRLVERAHDKIRQASRGMPAVMIRQLGALAKVMPYTTAADQRELLLEQAVMILRSSEESVPEAADREDVRQRYEEVLAAAAAQR